MSKSQLKAKHLEGERNKAHYRQCIPPCKRYMSAGDTHSLFVVCLGARHAESALEEEHARITGFFRCICFAPGRLCLMRRELSPALPAVPVPLPPRLWRSWGLQLDLM